MMYSSLQNYKFICPGSAFGGSHPNSLGETKLEVKLPTNSVQERKCLSEDRRLEHLNEECNCISMRMGPITVLPMIRNLPLLRFVLKSFSIELGGGSFKLI